MAVSTGILDLPNEILFNIFSYIDANTLQKNVSAVCQRLEEILSPKSSYWKIRLFKRFPDPYPIVQGCSKISWPNVCSAREMAYSHWGNNNNSMKYLNSPQYGYGINALQLSNNARLCFAGCVDKTIMVWDTNEAINLDDKKMIPQSQFPVPMNMFGHKGWIWSISNHPTKNEICSTSFDCMVKLWDIDHCCETGKENMIKDSYLTVPVRSPALCSKYIDENNIAVGLNNKSVVLIDSRAGSISNKHIHHNNAVLCLDRIDENTIMTCSEDKQVAILDLRKGLLNKIILEDFAMSLDCHRDQFWIGDKAGFVSVYSLNDSKMTLIEKFDYKHFGKITGVKSTLGGVYSVSTDGFFKVHEPTLQGKCFASMNLHGGELTGISQDENITVVASATGMVALWNPDKKIDDDDIMDLSDARSNATPE